MRQLPAARTGCLLSNCRSPIPIPNLEAAAAAAADPLVRLLRLLRRLCGMCGMMCVCGAETKGAFCAYVRRQRGNATGLSGRWARGGRAGRKQTSLPACRKLPRLLLRAGSAANHKKKKLEPATCVLKISAQKGNPTTAATTNGKCFNDDASHMSQPQQQQSQPFVATLRAARQLPNGSWPATFYATHRQHEEQLQQQQPQQQLPMAEKDRTGTDGGTDVLLDDLAGGPLDFH